MSEKIETYFKLLELRQNTESNRWTRFNTLLIVDGLLLAAWTQVLGSSIKSAIIILIILPILGVALNAVWHFLSVSTNKYHRLYNDQAMMLEKDLGDLIPCKIREAENETITYTDWRRKAGTSTWLSEWVPIIFVVLFIGMTILSLLIIW